MTHNITSSSSPRCRDYVVVFDTTNVSGEDAELLQKEASGLLSSRSVAEYISRTISLLVRKKKTIAMIHYSGSYCIDSHDATMVTADMEAVVEQLKAILSILDDDKKA